MSGGSTSDSVGLNIRVVQQLFHMIDARAISYVYTCQLMVCEIYNEVRTA